MIPLCKCATDILLVGFEGRLIECFSLYDAMAVKSAQHALLDDTDCEVQPGELERWAKVLECYGLSDAASQLSQLSAKKRAVQFLVATVGYEPPYRQRQS
jgi:hypothetical protein